MNKLTMKDAILKSPGPSTLKDFITFFIKAFCMGCADLIPGVSGGTIAFITGIYEDLLAAIASINKDVLLLLLKGRLKQAISIVHVRVLFVLLFGMLTAIFSLARLMHYLMIEHTILTWATFFGLIGASIVVIFKELKSPFEMKNIISLVIGAILAWLMVSLIPVETPTTSWFIYLCGIIGITAMILPGLSGSFLLLILGKYEYITSAVKSPFVEGNFIILITFALGSVTGVMGFSRVLNYFLKNYRSQTMAFLTGILIGSMKKVWPWKEVLETAVIRGKVRVLRDMNVLPEGMNSQTMMAIALMIVGFILVLLMESQVNKNKK
jgi:putative membrane protein